MSLRDYGWSDYFSQAFDQVLAAGCLPGRIVLVHRDLFVLAADQQEVQARVCGKLRQAEEPSAVFPVIGDWVAWSGGHAGTNLIHAVLPRKTLLARKRPGNRVEQQAIAANVDMAFLVMGLDQNFSLRRMERMLTVTYESGAVPVIVLTKVDLAEAPATQIASVESIAPGVPVLPVCSHSGEGLGSFGSFLGGQRTVVFLGSSGVGKSTLINRLFGTEMMRTAEVRAGDGRGRHTTTHRQLFRHPGGALLIDSPGIRELQLWCSEDALQSSFEDIEEIAAECRFRDCSHVNEPGCAVLTAVQEGALSLERLESFHKLSRELRYLAIKQDEGAQRAQKQRWKAIHKAARHNPKS